MVLFTDFVKRRLSCRRRTDRKPPVPVRKFPLDEDLAIKAKLTMPPVTIDIPELCAVYVGAGITQNQKKKPRVELKLYPHHFRLTLEKRADWYPYVQMHSVYTVKKKSALGIVYKQNDGTYLCVCLKIKHVKKQRRFRRNNVKITGEEVKRVILERLNRQEIEGVPKWEPPQGFRFSESGYSLINDEESLSEIYTNDEGESLSDFEPSQLNNDSRPCPSHGRRHPPVHREDSLTHTNSDRPEGFPNYCSEMPHDEDTVCEPPVLRSMSHLSVRVPRARSERSLLSYSDAESNVLSSYYDGNDELSVSSLSISSSVYSLCSEMELFDEMIEAQRQPQGSQNSTETLAESCGSTEKATVATEQPLATKLATEATAAAPEEVVASNLDTITAASVVASKLAVTVATGKVSVSNLCASATESATEDTEHSAATLCLPGEENHSAAVEVRAQGVALCSHAVSEDPLASSKNEQPVATELQSDEVKQFSNEPLTSDAHFTSNLDSKKIVTAEEKVVASSLVAEAIEAAKKRVEDLNLAAAEPQSDEFSDDDGSEDFESAASTEQLAAEELPTDGSPYQASPTSGTSQEKVIAEEPSTSNLDTTTELAGGLALKCVTEEITTATEKDHLAAKQTLKTTEDLYLPILSSASSLIKHLSVADTQTVAPCSHTVSEDPLASAKDEQPVATELQSDEVKQFSNEPLTSDVSPDLFASNLASKKIVTAEEKVVASSLVAEAIEAAKKRVEALNLAAAEPQSDEFSNDDDSEDFESAASTEQLAAGEFPTCGSPCQASPTSGTSQEKDNAEEPPTSNLDTTTELAGKEEGLASKCVTEEITTVEGKDHLAAEGTLKATEDLCLPNLSSASSGYSLVEHLSAAETQAVALSSHTVTVSEEPLTSSEDKQPVATELQSDEVKQFSNEPLTSDASPDLFASNLSSKKIVTAEEKVVASSLVAEAIEAAKNRVEALNVAAAEPQSDEFSDDDDSEDFESAASTEQLAAGEFPTGGSLCQASPTSGTSQEKDKPPTSNLDTTTELAGKEEILASKCVTEEITTAKEKDYLAAEGTLKATEDLCLPNLSSASSGYSLVEHLSAAETQAVALSSHTVTVSEEPLTSSDDEQTDSTEPQSDEAKEFCNTTTQLVFKSQDDSFDETVTSTTTMLSDEDGSDNVTKPLTVDTTGQFATEESTACGSLSQESPAPDPSQERITEEPSASKLATTMELDVFASNLATEIIVAAKEEVLASKPVTEAIVVTNLAAEATTKAEAQLSSPDHSADTSFGDSLVENLSAVETQAVVLCSHTISEEPLTSSKDEQTVDTEPQSDEAKEFCNTTTQLVFKSQEDSFDETVTSTTTVLSDEDGSDNVTKPLTVDTTGQFATEESTACGSLSQESLAPDPSQERITEEPSASKLDTTIELDVFASNLATEIIVAAKEEVLASKPITEAIVATNLAAEATTKAEAQLSSPDLSADTSFGDSLVENLSAVETQAVVLCSHTISEEPLTSSKDEQTVDTEPQSDEAKEFRNTTTQLVFKSQEDSFDETVTFTTTVLSDEDGSDNVTKPLTVDTTGQFATEESTACGSLSQESPAPDPSQERITKESSATKLAITIELDVFASNLDNGHKQEMGQDTTDHQYIPTESASFQNKLEKLARFSESSDSYHCLKRPISFPGEKVMTEEPLASDTFTKVITEEPLTSFQPQQLDSRPRTRHGHSTAVSKDDSQAQEATKSRTYAQVVSGTKINTDIIVNKADSSKVRQEVTRSRTYAQVVSGTKVNAGIIVNEGDSSKVQEATQSHTYAQVVSGTKVNIDGIINDGGSLCKSRPSQSQLNSRPRTRHGCPKDKPQSVSLKEFSDITVAAKEKVLASKLVSAEAITAATRKVVDTNLVAEATTTASAEFSLPTDASSGDSLVEHLSVAGTQAVALCSHTVSEEPLTSSKDEHTLTEPQSDDDFSEAASRGRKSQNDSFNDLKTVGSTVLSNPLYTKEPLTPVGFTEQFAIGEFPACRSQHLTSDISPDKDVTEGTLSSDICTENVIAEEHPTSKLSCGAVVEPQLLDNAQTSEIVPDAMTMNRDQCTSADSTSFQFEAWFPESLGRPVDEEGPELDNLKNSAEVEDLLESDPSILIAVFEAPGITPEEVASKKKVIIEEPTETAVTGEPLASHPCPEKATAEEPGTSSTSKSNNATVESLLQFCYNYMDKKQKPERTVPDTMAAKDQKFVTFQFVERLISYARCPDNIERDVIKEKVVTEEPPDSDSFTNIITEEPLMSFQPQKLDSRPRTRHGRPKEDKPDIEELCEAINEGETLQEPEVHSRPCTRHGRSTTISKEEAQKPKAQEETQPRTYAQVLSGTKVNSGPSQPQLNCWLRTSHGRPNDKPESEVSPKVLNKGESLHDKSGPSKSHKKRGHGHRKKLKNKGTPKKLSNIADDRELMCESGPSQPENDSRPCTRHGRPKEDVNIERASNGLSEAELVHTCEPSLPQENIRPCTRRGRSTISKEEELSGDKAWPLSEPGPSQAGRPRTRRGCPKEEPEPEITITPKIISGAEVYTVDEGESQEHHEMDFDASTYPGMDMNVDWDVPQNEPSYADHTTSGWYPQGSDQYTQNWDQDSDQHSTGYVPRSGTFTQRCSQGDGTHEESQHHTDYIPYSESFAGSSSPRWNQDAYSNSSDECTSPITCGYDENDEFVWPTPGPNGMMELVKDTLYATKEDGEYFLHIFRRSSNGETTMITQPYTNIRKERAEYEKQNPVIIEELS